MLPLKLKRGDKTSQIFDRWNQLIDYLHETRISGGQGIRLSKMPSGTVISAVRQSGSGSASGVAAADAGPFAVTIEEGLVRLRNSAGDSGVAGVVTVGSRRVTWYDQEWEPLRGVVYLDIAYDDKSEEYTVLFDLEPELPETGDEKRYILRIAEIVYNSDTDDYTAVQIRPPGDIEVTGRWVR